MTAETIIPGLVGPGTQPENEDGATLDYMEMPRDMVTFHQPLAPEPEDTLGMEEAKALLNQMADDLANYKIDSSALTYSLNSLAPKDLGLINQIMGEGEVSIVCGTRYQAQESVLAGVWRVVEITGKDNQISDNIEVAAYPDSIFNETFKTAAETIELDSTFPEGVRNAPPVLSEIKDKVANYRAGQPCHAINLTLLPQTDEDIAYLAEKLGVGTTIILSRGYGNCRVSSTMTKNVWWVQYFNSQDATILNSIEIVDLPDVVRAAQEDILDSAERLSEIMEVYK
ncbi:hydrogenase expression/formation protein [Terasakiella sp. SH-1]|uniref:hydrogenase expression/formation protein n=1 Tax=Terasakiella sp. SH-1 TaxID=2560057 RepID=UPI0010731D50|nr:hydrogenase expression/formation protein [Terasakiella sp. SH-1]